MTPSTHRCAASTHYDTQAKNYDAFQEKWSRTINSTLEKILRKYRAKTVLDLTCGTGLQVFWLAKRGYEVTGSDISEPMLRIARRKARQESWNVQLSIGDMRTSRHGMFDAVLTIS